MTKSSTTRKAKTTPRAEPIAAASGMTAADYQELLQEALAALELCLASPQLTWEAEQEADVVSRKLKNYA
jgi:hypothetical protein